MEVQFAFVIILYSSVFDVQNAIKQVPREINTEMLNNNSTVIFKHANATPWSIKYSTSSESINKTKYNQISMNMGEKETLKDIEEKSKHVNNNKIKNITKRNGPRKKKSEFNDDPEYLYNEDKNKENIPIDGAIDRSLPVFDSVKGGEYIFKPVRNKWDGKHNVEIELYEGIDNEQTEFPTRSTELETKISLNGNDDKQPTTVSTSLEADRNENSKIKSTKESSYDDIRADNLDDTLSDMTNTAKVELKSMKTKYDEDKKNPVLLSIPSSGHTDSHIVPTRFTEPYYEILPIQKEEVKEPTRVNHRTESNTETAVVYFTVASPTLPIFYDNEASSVDLLNRERSQNIPHRTHLDFKLDKHEDVTTKNVGGENTQTEKNEDTKFNLSTDSLISTKEGGEITTKPAKLNIVEAHYYDDDDSENKDYDITLNDVTTSSTENTSKKDNFNEYRTTPTTTTKHIHNKKHKVKEYHKQPFNIHPFSKKVNPQKLLTDDEIFQLTFDKGFKPQLSDIRSLNLEKKLEKYINITPDHNNYNTKSMDAVITARTPPFHTTYKKKKVNFGKDAHTGHKAKIPSLRKDNINRNINNRYTTKGTTLTVDKMILIKGRKLGPKTTTFNTPVAAKETTASWPDIRKNITIEHSNISKLLTTHDVKSTTEKISANKLDSTLVKLKASMNKLLSWELPKHTLSVYNNHKEVTARYPTTLHVEAVTSHYNKKISTILPWYKNKSMHYNVLPLKMHTTIETSPKPYEHYNKNTSVTLPSPMVTTTDNIISKTTTTLMQLYKSPQALQKTDNITAYKAKRLKITANEGFLLQTKVPHGVEVNDRHENDLASVTKQISKSGALNKSNENTFTPDKVTSRTPNFTMKVSNGNITITTQSMTDKILNKLLKVNPAIEQQVSSSILDRDDYVNKTSSLYRTLVQITLKEILDKLLNTSHKKKSSDEIDRGDFKGNVDDNITDLIFSKTFLKGVFSPSNLYNTPDNTTLPPKDSYLNSNLGETADIQSVSDTDRTNIFDNEPVFSDPEMHEYKSTAKTLVENILNIILNDTLGNSPENMKQKQLRNVSAYKHDIVNRVLKVLNNKTNDRVLPIKEFQSSANASISNIFKVTKNTVIPTSTTKRNFAKLYSVTFEEVLPLAIDYTQTSTSNTVTTMSMTTVQETQVTTESNLFFKHTFTPSIIYERTTETTEKDQDDYDNLINTTNIMKSTDTMPNEELNLSALSGLKTNNHIITTPKIHDNTNNEIQLNDVNIINDSNGELPTTSQTVISTELKTSIVTENGVYTTSFYETDSRNLDIENNTHNSNENMWFIQYENKNQKHSDSFLGYTIPFSSTTSVLAYHSKVKSMEYDNIGKADEEIYYDYGDSTTTANPTLSLTDLTSYEENHEVTEKNTHSDIDEALNKTYKKYKNNLSPKFTKTDELSDNALNSFIGDHNVKNKAKNDFESNSDLTTDLVTDRQHQRFISKDQLNVPNTIFEDKAITLSSFEMLSRENSTEETMITNGPINFPQIESSTPISHTSRYFYPELESSQQEILKEAKVMSLNKTSLINNNWNFGNIYKSTPSYKHLEEVSVEGYTEATNQIIKNSNKSSFAEYTSSKDVDNDLDKVAVALKSFLNDEPPRIGPNTGITPHIQDKTLVDVNPEEISEMLYYDSPDNQHNKAVSSTSRSVSNKTSLLTGEILNTLLNELMVMNDVAEKKLSVKNIKFPIKLDPFDPNLENVIRNLLLNKKNPSLMPKHPGKVAIFEVGGKDKGEVENELYPKKVSVYDADLKKVLLKIMPNHTMPASKKTEPSKATTRKPIKVQWHEFKNPDGRKSNTENCPKIHCFLVNDSTDKSKSKIGIIDKLQEINPVISNSNNSDENFPIYMDFRKSFNLDKKPVTNNPEYNKNKSERTQNKTILPTYIPAKSFFYKKPEAVESFTNNLHGNTSIVKMEDSGSINVPSINMCGLENTPLHHFSSHRLQEGSSNIEKYPWLGVLIYPKGKKHLVTTVVLVTVQLVITSAWEISKLPKDDFRRCSKVIIGHNCSGPRIAVLNYNYHPDFKAGFLSSLAVVQIDSENYVHVLRPICPPPRHFLSPQFYSMVMPEDCTSSRIKIYKMDHVSMDVCRGYYRQHKVVTSRFWPRHSACGKSRWGGACLWRSGTVLVVKQGPRWHLLGFGVPGPGCEAPSRYIDYSMQARWVDLMLQRIGQSSVTRMAPNRIIFRRCVNQIQRFGPCDAEEVSKPLFQESSELEPVRATRRGRQLTRAQYNLTVSDNIDYHCVVFQAYNVKDTTEIAQPKLEIKRNAPEDRGNAGNHPANVHFNVTIDFYDGVRYKVLAYGERSKRNDLIQVSINLEDNILKTLAEHAENYITKTTQNYENRKFERPAWDVNRRYIRRKSLEKYKNSYKLFHNKMTRPVRPRRKTMEQASRRKAKSRTNRRKKAGSSDMKRKRNITSKKKKRQQSSSSYRVDGTHNYHKVAAQNVAT